MTSTTPAATPSEIARKLAEIAWQAGEIILRHYDEGVEARTKDDNSPVTAADEEAEIYILSQLRETWPEIGVVAEEEAAAGKIQSIGTRFFLVDPLDGTKEFIKKNGEFTVNIAEIEGGAAVRGVVYAPAKHRMFIGDAENGAFEITTAPHEAVRFDHARRIEARRAPKDGIIAVGSRSHRAPETEEFLADYKVKDFLAAGSSLKFCLVAAGEADIYPRHGRTMEWDTGAGHAVLNAAGGSVTQFDGSPFTYGKTAEGFANPFFVARGKPA
jgi:3'(2'), 5'-bisphosphate nucleotidase